ncbi:hypothetical protein R3P38DRAFT_2784814 [Favolaschia claudopus]|uniref:Uncharacterized protein n=1 Tax=Favolaschia claudopus TaxID=2862362 RepID=A0AAW0AWM3_9AGAR
MENLTGCRLTGDGALRALILPGQAIAKRKPRQRTQKCTEMRGQSSCYGVGEIDLVAKMGERTYCAHYLMWRRGRGRSITKLQRNIISTRESQGRGSEGEWNESYVEGHSHQLREEREEGRRWENQAGKELRTCDIRFEDESGGGSGADQVEAVTATRCRKGSDLSTERMRLEAKGGGDIMCGDLEDCGRDWVARAEASGSASRWKAGKKEWE